VSIADSNEILVKQLLVAGFLMVASAHLAFGALGLELELTDGTNTALINSSGTLALTGSASATTIMSGGVYTLDATVGNYSVNVSTGEGSPLLPPGTLDLNSVDTAIEGSGTLKIWWSENGITSVFGGWSMQWGGTLSTGAGGNVSATAYEDNTNAFFGTQSTIGTIGPQGPGVVGGAAGSSVATVTAPYSLSELITLNGVGPTTYSGDASLTPSSDAPLATIPEPASVILFGGAILTVATALRRKLTKKA
jgi:hypothetical protein